MGTLRTLTIATCLLAGSAAELAARDYYVSPTGNDSNSGASPSEAWLTINRLNLVAFQPGDRILLAGGATFAGQLMLDAGDVGSPTEPLVVTSYGTGRATIDATAGTAIQIYNTAGVRIADLNLAGAGPAGNGGSGVSAYTDLGGDVKLRFLQIERVNASGFGRSGVEIGGGNGASGFRDVTIRFVAAWGNRDGILSYGPVRGTHANVYVGYSKAFDNRGIDSPDSTGNGIVLGAVDGAVIERSVARSNGGGAIGPHGPIGIWTYHSNNVTIQFNESYDNRTGGWADGGGFALDVGVTNSRVQYNYTHGNEGAGLLLAGGFDPADHANNIVRYNISQNDGRRNGFSGIQIWGKTRNTHVYNNTIFSSADAGFETEVVSIGNAYADGHYAVGVSFRNNIFYASGGIPNLYVTAAALNGASIRFEHNNYFGASGPRIVWAGVSYATVADWAAATGQEIAGGRLLGSSGDPRLVSPGGGGSLDDATRLTAVTAYKLRTGSPAIDAGAAVSAAGIDPGPHDYYETALYAGAGYDVGAHEWTPGSEPPAAAEIVLYAGDVATQAGNWTLVSDASAAGGRLLRSSDRGGATIATPLASPGDYFEMSFPAVANTRYRLWLRLRAQGESKYNDSVYVQFANAVSAGGAPLYRIGTTEALNVNLATCGSCVPQGWGWQNRAYWLADSGEIWFATSGTQTLRVQIREDGVEVDQIVLSPARYLDAAPGPATGDATIVPKPSGPAPAPAPAPAPTAAEIVLYAGDVATQAGNWTLVNDASAAGGRLLRSSDRGAATVATPLASPGDYFEMSFSAVASTRYRLWLRLRAQGESKYNDSVYVQFANAVSAGGAPLYRIGTTEALNVNLATCGSCVPQGWGWQNRAYWLADSGEIWFATSGTQTLRVQIREDGVELDQIVLSPARYADAAPGSATQDATIVTKP